MPADPQAHTFPAAHVLQLVTLVARWGITAEELLQGAGLREHELEVPNARVSVHTLSTLTERARTLTAEPGLGFYLGLQKRLSMYGYLGFAQMHAATVRESLELAVRYAPTVTTGLSLSLDIDGDFATVTVHEHVDLGSAHDIALFSFLVGTRQLTTTMTGRSKGRVSIDIPLPKPDYFDRFAHLLPGARFDACALRICFPARGLDVPLVTPDRAALSLAREACERMLQDLGFDRSLPARVQRLLEKAQVFPTITEVARSLRQSTRTLKRKLAAEGVSFSELLERARRARAERLLGSTALPLEEIAEQLDYSTLPNFARAFRRWTGQTPAAYRKQHRRALSS